MDSSPDKPEIGQLFWTVPEGNHLKLTVLDSSTGSVVWQTAPIYGGTDRDAVKLRIPARPVLNAAVDTMALPKSSHLLLRGANRANLKLPRQLKMTTPRNPRFYTMYREGTPYTPDRFDAVVRSTSRNHELFNLRNDPMEVVNLSKEFPEQLDAMKARLDQLLKEMQKSMPSWEPQH